MPPHRWTPRTGRAMYEKFTDRARKVMKLAKDEAERFNYPYIGSEHILLGLIKEGSGVGANVLKNLDLDLRKIRLEVEKLVSPTSVDDVAPTELPHTPHAKKIIEHSMQEARSLNHNYVGTEHLLLGLLCVHEGLAARVLRNLGLKLEEVRKEVLNLLGHGIEATEQTVPCETEHRATIPPARDPKGTETGRSMFANFTDRARRVMQLSNQEAQRFNHEYIGTEHILLGLIKEGSGVAANVLKNLDVDLRRIRLEIEKLVQSGPDMVTMGRLPQTPRAKKIIEYSMEEARGLNHNYVGTEHILLGLLREQEGVGAQVLMNLGLKLEEVRAEVLNVLGARVESNQWAQRGVGPLRQPNAEAERTGPRLEFQDTRRAARQLKLATVLDKAPKLSLKTTVLVLSWIFLIVGIVGLSLGVSGESDLTLPGAILIGASLIALALGPR